MIISASRRTDIPAFYGEWIMNRLRERFVLTRNPMNSKQVSRISLAPRDVDCLVFWTKNPKNFIRYLDEIEKSGFRYYFQFTLNPYENDLEPGLPSKTELTETFIELSKRTGKEKTIWRYDPVIINEKYTVKFHADTFSFYCEKLKTHTEKCVLSFADNYYFLNNEFDKHGIKSFSQNTIMELAEYFSAAGKKSGIKLFSCAEKINPEKYGIAPNRCVDAELINRIFNLDIRYKKDSAQRDECGCSVSRDIGSYNTCLHNCVYCYTKRGKKAASYDPLSPMLCDALNGTETITGTPRVE